MPATPVLLGPLEALLNRGIEASSEARALARGLEGAALAVEVAGIGRFRAGIVRERLALGSGAAGEAAAATITGSPASLVRLALGGTGPAAEGGAVRVSGDAEVAAAFRALFAAARPDLEEELSRWVGDLAARRLAGAARGASDWLRGALRTAGENVAEYLTEESRDLVNAVELEEYLRGVDELREAADRIEARLARLERRLEGRA